MKTQNTRLRDALYVLSPNSGASQEYKHGLLTGLIAGLMTRMSYATAIKKIALNLPADLNWADVHPAFSRDLFQEKYFFYIKKGLISYE